MVTTNRREATPACTVCRGPLALPKDRQAMYRGRRIVRSMCPFCFLTKKQIDAAHKGERTTMPLSPDLVAEREARIRMYRRRAKLKLPLFTEQQSSVTAY